MNEYTTTVVLKQEDVDNSMAEEAQKTEDRRRTAAALEAATQGAHIAALDRTVGHIVDHQIESTRHIRAIRSETQICTSQVQLLRNEHTDSAARAAGYSADIEHKMVSLERMVKVSVTVTWVSCLLLAILVWLK